jgi:hypothetical protein
VMISHAPTPEPPIQVIYECLSLHAATLGTTHFCFTRFFCMSHLLSASDLLCISIYIIHVYNVYLITRFCLMEKKLWELMLHLQQLESYLEALPKPDHEDPDPDPYFERAPTPVFVPWPLGPAKETQVIILERLPSSFASFSFLLLNKNWSFHFILTCGYKCIWWGLCYDLSLAGCIETNPEDFKRELLTLNLVRYGQGICLNLTLMWNRCLRFWLVDA